MLFAAQEAEPRIRDDEVEEAGLGADRAVALLDGRGGWRLDFESHCAAMAGACVFHFVILPDAWLKLNRESGEMKSKETRRYPLAQTMTG
jgi:hypothetical protein